MMMRFMTAGMVSWPCAGAVGSPASCSGAMYKGVPMTEMVAVLADVARLKSRWTTPAMWTAAGAVAVPTASR
jgi:TPP-dependent indolepyruvate ferredoxin oxidoreductase alpha subunit